LMLLGLVGAAEAGVGQEPASGCTGPGMLPQPAPMAAADTSQRHSWLLPFALHDSSRAPFARLAVAGLVGGGLGVLWGRELAGRSGTQAYVGAVLGEALFLPVGVHVANRHRGNYVLDLLASVAIAGAGALVAGTVNSGSDETAAAVLAATGLTQIVAVIGVERSIERRASMSSPQLLGAGFNRLWSPCAARSAGRRPPR
jgi:hypothetical protein